MSEFKRTLLLCSSPETGGVGDIFLSDAVEGIDSTKLVKFTLGDINPSVVGAWKGFETRRRKLKISRWPGISSINFAKFEISEKDGIVEEIKNIILTESIERVWVVLSSVPLISIAEHLIEKVDLPIHAMVWDAPEALFQNHMLDFFVRKKVLKGFASVLQNAHRVAVISEGMQNIYKSRYGVDSIVIRHGAKESPRHKENLDPPRKSVVKIVFAGSLYAKREWNAFGKALERCDFKIADCEVDVCFLGRFPRFGAKRFKKVTYLGHTPYENVAPLLSTMSGGYVPYWFSRRKAHVVNTSFPGKISAYASAGLPILFHGPTYSSVVPFLEKYNIGVACVSLEEGAILEALTKFVEGLQSDVSFAWRENACRAVHEELGSESMQQKLDDFFSSRQLR